MTKIVTQKVSSGTDIQSQLHVVRREQGQSNYNTEKYMVKNIKISDKVITVTVCAHKILKEERNIGKVISGVIKRKKR